MSDRTNKATRRSERKALEARERRIDKELARHYKGASLFSRLRLSWRAFTTTYKRLAKAARAGQPTRVEVDNGGR
jgi:hypothetical protein